MIALVLVIRTPSPTIMPERIGIIGKTHGVNASKNPNIKNEKILNNKLFSFNFFVITSCSDINISLLIPSSASNASKESGIETVKFFSIGG